MADLEEIRLAVDVPLFLFIYVFCFGIWPFGA